MSASSGRPADTYSPLYFLTSLGAGGLVVTFFMWLMHWTKHPGHPVPVFEDITASFAAGESCLRLMIILALAGIAVYAFLNLKYLVWNLVRFNRFQRTSAYEQMASSNAQTQVLAMPLALAMSVNVFFVLGMVFVPGLWSVVEYLFPVAIVVFLAIGVLAFRMFGTFMGRVMSVGGFSCASNNSFAQALPAFALAMIGVGLAAPAGLSASPVVAGTGLVLSTFFLVAAALIAAIALVLGIRSLAENGANVETAPTLSVFIPVLTIVSILSLRQNHGLNAHFGLASGGVERLMMLSQYLSAQILFALLTGLVLSRLGYFSRFITGREASPGSYALVCPGVALAVMVHFWLNRGVVDSGLIDKFSPEYWAITSLALAIQFATALLVFVLNRKHFKGA
ncbi:TsoY family (seleno)protein [Desulfoplanes sp.]